VGRPWTQAEWVDRPVSAGSNNGSRREALPQSELSGPSGPRRHFLLLPGSLPNVSALSVKSVVIRARGRRPRMSITSA
jgi:hypothetical protein